MWENRTPYKYDRGNDILHMGTPGHFHRHLEAPILDWYNQHPFKYPGQFLDGAIQGNTHAIWMRPNVTPEHIERLEAAVGMPLTKGHDPDSIAEQADMDMDDGWDTSPEDWDKQFAQGSVKTANEENWHAFSRVASATTVYRGAARVAPWNVLDNPASLADQFTRGLWTTDKSNANYYATFEQDSEADNEAYNSDRFWIATVIYEAIADQAGFEMNPDRYENDQNNEYLVQAGVDPLAMYVTLVEYDKDDQNFDAWGGEIDKPVEVASQTASFSYVNGAWVKS
jgi:hypothetical protein